MRCRREPERSSGVDVADALTPSAPSAGLGRATSIVVLNYNTRELLLACIASVRRHALEAELIVVDNASPDGSAAAVRERYPDVRLIACNENGGFARGINAGLRAASRPYVFALNADTTLVADTLPELVRALERFPRAGVAGPVQHLPHPDDRDRCGAQLASVFADLTLAHEIRRLVFQGDRIAYRFRRGPWRIEHGGEPREVDWLMGAALFFRRECLTAVVGFDESEFMYGEDWDLCYRARHMGWQVLLVPDAHIVHHENASGKTHFGWRRKARVMGATLHFHERHFGRSSRRLFAGVNLVAASCRLIALLPVAAFPSRDGQWRNRVRAEFAVARTALNALGAGTLKQSD